MKTIKFKKLIIVQSKLDKARGTVATVLVQKGTLKRGDIVVVGAQVGRVRAITNERGQQLQTAGPSEPVEIMGLEGVPEPGDVLNVVENENRAREVANYRARAKKQKTTGGPSRTGTSLESIMAKFKDSTAKELPILIKADVQGSAEAIVGSLEKLAHEEVRARVVLSGVGAINESDVQLAKGGGKGEGIGLGNIGTIGHGAGTGTGQGFGNGSGRLGGTHKSKPSSVRMGATSVSGRLPPEVIQRIVRQNFGRFRLCYENGLRNNPNLAGRVSVSFTIGRDGSVGSVSGGGDLPDPGVIGCVTKAFYGLSFPQPEGGVVKVSYPIAFAPGG